MSIELQQPGSSNTADQQQPNGSADAGLANAEMLWPDEQHLQAQGQGDAKYRCTVGNLNFLFDPAISIEVLMDISVHRMPHTPEWLLGMCNRRGDLIPVFDLHSLLNQGHARDQRRYLLIIDRSEYTAAFYINHYPVSVYSAEPASNTPAVPDNLRPHVLNCWQHENIPLLEIDHRGLFEDITRDLSASGAIAREDLYQAPEGRN